MLCQLLRSGRNSHDVDRLCPLVSALPGLLASFPTSFAREVSFVRLVLVFGAFLCDKASGNL